MIAMIGDLKSKIEGVSRIAVKINDDLEIIIHHHFDGSVGLQYEDEMMSDEDVDKLYNVLSQYRKLRNEVENERVKQNAKPQESQA